jgi:hypothetical protein
MVPLAFGLASIRSTAVKMRLSECSRRVVSLLPPVGRLLTITSRGPVEIALERAIRR